MCTMPSESSHPPTDHSSSRLREPNGVLVIGYGNEMREDDGLGPFVSQRIAALQLPNVYTLQVHQLLPELAEVLSTKSLAVFVDCHVAPCGEEREEITVRRLAPDSSTWSMTHVFRPQLLLALAQTLYGRRPESWIVEILGDRFGSGRRLSPSARQRAETAVDAITNLLRPVEQLHSVHVRQATSRQRVNY